MTSPFQGVMEKVDEEEDRLGIWKSLEQGEKVEWTGPWEVRDGERGKGKEREGRKGDQERGSQTRKQRSARPKRQLCGTEKLKEGGVSRRK